MSNQSFSKLVEMIITRGNIKMSLSMPKIHKNFLAHPLYARANVVDSTNHESYFLIMSLHKPIISYFVNVANRFCSGNCCEIDYKFFPFLREMDF